MRRQSLLLICMGLIGAVVVLSLLDVRLEVGKPLVEANPEEKKSEPPQDQATPPVETENSKPPMDQATQENSKPPKDQATSQPLNLASACKNAAGVVQALHTLFNMTSRERKVFSQFTEDGVLEAIFEVLGTTDKFYVEFGVEVCSECNTKNLWANHGWNGVLLDGKPRVTGDSRIIYEHWISAENIVQIFESHNISKEFDLLSVDLDSIDYWVGRAIFQGGYKPRAFVTEINMNFERNEAFTVPPGTLWIQAHWGASPYALSRMAKSFGYIPVHITNGVNLFFVRESAVLESLMKVGDCVPEAGQLIISLLPTWDSASLSYKPGLLHTHDFLTTVAKNYFCDVNPDGSPGYCCKNIRVNRTDCLPPYPKNMNLNFYQSLQVGIP